MRQIIKALLFFLSMMISAQNQSDPGQAVLEKLVTNEFTVGASGAYTIGDSIVWKSAVGYADQKNNVLFKTSTKVRMASIAKSMTALAIMQLVEQNKLDLDAPIQKYIPDYPKQQGTQITAHHLLSHTSGIGGYKNTKEANTTKEYASLSEALDIFKNRELLFKPGTKYSYTTYGYTVLGVILERISGQSFEEYMQMNIWNRAGMTETGVVKFGVAKDSQSLLYHRKGGKGKPKEGNENNLSNRIPGGGFYTTVDDMLKFGNAVLNNTFVKEETLGLMREHHSLEKVQNGYGFGWFLYSPMPNEGEVFGHSGAQMGCSSQLYIVPKTKSVVVVLTNTSRVNMGGAAYNLFRLSQGKSIMD